jgi:acetyltransferase-like isoleucine patch superfamily enzyme
MLIRAADVDHKPGRRNVSPPSVPPDGLNPLRRECYPGFRSGRKSMALNSVRRKSANMIANEQRVSPDAVLIPPVRTYQDVTIDKGSKVGKYTYFGNGSYVTNATIGNYCAIARFVEIGTIAHPQDMLSCHTFQYAKSHFDGQPGYDCATVKPSMGNPKKKTVIGNDVWIGAKVAIKGGVKIGDGAILGSHSVITKDVPPYAVMVGAPARILRYRFPPEVIERLLASKWWTLEPIDMDGVAFAKITKALGQIERRKAALAKRVLKSLSKPLTNNSAPSSQGILWFDVEKSYAVPEVIKQFRFVRFENGDQAAITSAWFNDEKNRFGMRVEGLEGRLEKRAVRFSLEIEAAPKQDDPVEDAAAEDVEPRDAAPAPDPDPDPGPGPTA